MANGYIPRKDSLAITWMKTFAAGISASPSVFQLSPSDAAAIQRAVDEFAGALAVASDPATKTKVTVAIKDQARISAEQICQQYYSLIKPNAGVSDASKIAIGVRPINRGRTPIAAPATSPAVAVIAATPWQHTLRFHDSLAADTRGKPFGATFLELRVAVDDEPVRDVEQARPAGLFTKNPVTMAFRHDEVGKRATYWGRWVSRRGETGPWSLPVGMTVAA
jgi:hypothetical protein